MSGLRLVLAILVVLGLQIGLGRLWPAAPRWIDFHMLPVIAYAMKGGSQRTAMWVGCASGLLQDAWFHAGIFGLNGFKKTLFGWTLAGLNGRFDLQGGFAQFLAGVVFSLADSLLDPALRRLIDREVQQLAAWQIGVKALGAGLIVVIAFRIVDGVRRHRSRGR